MIGGSTIQTANPQRITTSATSKPLCKANEGRSEVIVFNESTQVMYVLYGPGSASSTNYTIRLNAGDILIEDYFKGAMSAAWASDDTSAAMVTELS